MSIKLTGRTFQDPNLHPELNSLVDQMNKHLSSVSASIVQRKYSVIPSGVVDGVNVNFTAKEDFNPSTLVVWNGSTKQSSTAYKIQNRTVIFSVAPISGGTIEFDYDPKASK